MLKAIFVHKTHKNDTKESSFIPQAGIMKRIHGTVERKDAEARRVKSVSA